MHFARALETGNVLWQLTDGRFCDLTIALGTLAPKDVFDAVCDQDLHANLAWLPLREDYCLPASTALACPLPTPNRILAIGRNYADHAKELGNAIPDEPVVFQKANSSIIGPGESVVLPTAIGQVDHEGELLVVIGTGGRDIALDAALGHVAGYSIINDVTARAKSKALQAKGYPWFLAKCRDTFGPIGPVVVAANSLIDQFPLTIDVTVNGEVRQHGTTDQMIHDVAALIHYLSTVTELMPGDCIATGTPSGVGPLVAGDSVTVTISGIGTLTNPVI
jgi:2-keto-4-pentenoate hydratase/2-oxohepta-3-ene-1,7-dioic acid hydratase in catechol pathway